MSHNVSTVTRKGQVTIPVELRRRLGIHEGDLVEFTAIDDTIQVRSVRRGDTSESALGHTPSASVTEQTFGSLARYSKPWMTKEERYLAEEEAIAAGWTERERRFLAQHAKAGE